MWSEAKYIGQKFSLTFIIYSTAMYIVRRKIVVVVRSSSTGGVFYINVLHEEQVCFSLHLKTDSRDFPGGAVVKNPPANAGTTGSSPGPGRSHMPWNS